MQTSQIINAFVALIFVLSLIGIISILVRKYVIKDIKFNQSLGKRLQISDSLTIDQKRRLILIKCDDKEHLIMTCGDQNTVIQSEITTGNNEAR